jgi:hypothetical protein
MAGTLVGGLVVARISQRDDRWKLWAPAVTSGLAGPVFALCMLTPDFTTMVVTLAATSFLVGFHLGPIFAIAQTVARPSMHPGLGAIGPRPPGGHAQRGPEPRRIGPVEESCPWPASVKPPHPTRYPRHRIGPNTKPFWEPDETERKQIGRIGVGNKGRPETPRRLT